VRTNPHPATIANDAALPGAIDARTVRTRGSAAARATNATNIARPNPRRRNTGSTWYPTSTRPAASGGPWNPP
jgi:hypothetical protein